jgi:DNA mismatch repair protein MutL
MLIRAITGAYQTLIPRGRYPAVLLFLDLRPEEVDVNVHPMKSEVRFRRSGAVFDLVYHALRARLKDQVAADEGGGGHERYAGDGAVAAVDGAEASLVDGNAPGMARGSSESSYAFTSANLAPAGPGSTPYPHNGAPIASGSLRLVADAPSVGPAMQRPLGFGFRRDSNTGEAAAEKTAGIPVYSRLKILGQIFAGFVALEGEDGLILLDQHAAHERVTFEKLRAELRAGGVRTQPSLAPEVIELNPARAAQTTAALPEIRALGFQVEAFGPSALLLSGSPAVFGVEGGRALLIEMIDSIGENGFRARGEAAFEDLLKTLACHGSVRAGRSLEVREIVELLAELDRTEFKTNCPHGRPVHIEFPRGQIERMFRR